MEPSLLQTEKWGKLQEALGEKWLFERGEGWQFLAIVKKIPLGSYLDLPYGPFVTDKKAAKKCLERLQELAKKERAVFVRMEPQRPDLVREWLKRPVCRKVRDINPAETLRIDLTQEKEAIVANYDQQRRNYARNFGKKGLKVRIADDPREMKHLIRLQKELAGRKDFATFSERYLKTEAEQDFATLYLAYYDEKSDVAGPSKERPKDGQVVAASLFFDDETTRYYMQSAADGRYKNLPATVAIIYTAMMDAKDKGLKWFDLWGIAPEGAGADHPWYGFTKFKLAFGGEKVAYGGTYDMVLDSFRYRLYTGLRVVNRWARKAEKRIRRK